MTPTPDSEGMTDEQLIERVAVMMGWKRHRNGILGQQRYHTDRNVPQPEDWNPLEDWNDTMVLVEWMRAKGFIYEIWTSKGNHVCIRDANLKYRNYDVIVTINDVPLQQAICLAALKAISTPKP